MLLQSSAGFILIDRVHFLGEWAEVPGEEFRRDPAPDQGGSERYGTARRPGQVDRRSRSVGVRVRYATGDGTEHPRAALIPRRDRSLIRHRRLQRRRFARQFEAGPWPDFDEHSRTSIRPTLPGRSEAAAPRTASSEVDEGFADTNPDPSYSVASSAHVVRRPGRSEGGEAVGHETDAATDESRGRPASAAPSTPTEEARS